MGDPEPTKAIRLPPRPWETQRMPPTPSDERGKATESIMTESRSHKQILEPDDERPGHVPIRLVSAHQLVSDLHPIESTDLYDWTGYF